MLECLNVRMFECWNGGLEGLGGLVVEIRCRCRVDGKQLV